MQALRRFGGGWLLGLACLCSSLGANAQDVLPVPALTAHVMDSTGTLDAAQQQALEAKLTALEASNGTQLVVLLVPTTQPEDIFSYSNRVANAWKIGRKSVGDGLLVVVAKNDRKLRIEVSKTLEGAIPDLMASRVMDEAITPRFKAGDFAGGLDAGVAQLMALVRGEALPAPAAARGNASQGMDTWMGLLFAVLVGGSIARNILGGKLGSLLTGGAAGYAVMAATSSLLFAGLAGLAAALFTLIVKPGQGGPRGAQWGSTGGGWGAGRSSGSGGFSSGGGGDFGGGGASGSW